MKSPAQSRIPLKEAGLDKRERVSRTGFGRVAAARVLVGCALWLGPVGYAQNVLYVDDSAPSGGNGLTWGTAFDHLQDALDAATLDPNTGEIRVAGGAYVPTARTDPNDAQSTTFQLIDGVVVRGGYAGLTDPNNPDDRDVVSYASILDGQSYSYHVVMDLGVLSGTVLDGFTITGGNAVSWAPQNTGGGMYSVGSPTVANCVFLGNWAYDGGGLRVSDATVINCRFLGNAAEHVGGGLLSNGSELINCEFSGNEAIGGGGLELHGTNTLTNCTVAGNNVPSTPNAHGGGLYVYGTLMLTNCIVCGNSKEQVYARSGATVTVSYCNLSGVDTPTGETINLNWEGGNISVGCTFVDEDGADDTFGTLDDDYRLEQYSACVDAGDSTAVPLDDFDLDLDGNTSEQVPMDWAGNPRRINDPTQPDSGVDEPVVDMGAQERSTGQYFLFEDPVGVPEGSSKDVEVHLAWDPGTEITVLVAFDSGDADISVEDGGDANVRTG